LRYMIVECPSCRSRLRIPTNKGRIRITCPSCSHQFQMET
jgi:predicted Zn finger-like uncharacterized protein